MGKKQSRVEVKPIQPERRELTALQRWSQSQKSQEQLLQLLNQSTWAEWSQAVAIHLHNINNRERYQLHTATLLEFLKNARHLNNHDREQIYGLYSLRLASSFFVAGEFHQSSINLSLSSKEKLLFLYDYYTLLPELLQRALICNYPGVFKQFDQFVGCLVEKEIIMGEMEMLKKFILPTQRMEKIREEAEIGLKFYPQNLREKLLQQLKDLRDPKILFMTALEEFMRFDNADAACQFVQTIQLKGYILTDQEQSYLLTLRLYSLFVYSFGKLSISFTSFRSKATHQLLHLFYQEQSIEETPLLLNCFRGVTNAGSAILIDYCFSSISHISLAVRLMERGYLHLSGNRQEWNKLEGKVLISGCEIGRYCDYLTTLAQSFKVEQEPINKMCHLLKLAEIMNIFGTNATIQDISPLVYSHQELNLTQSTSLKVLQMLIIGFFNHDQIQSKSVVVQGQRYSFATLFDLLKFLGGSSEYITKGSIKIGSVHQILFRQLLSRGYYQQIGALLKKQNLVLYQICFEMIEPLVISKMIQLVTTKLIRKIEGSLSILMGSIGLGINSSHYAVAYYRYFCCLQDVDIQLPEQTKSKIGLDHFYYIVDKFPTKIQKIDFDYLYTQQTCIRQLFNNTRTDFIAAVTDQYLKFKTYLSSRCFELKKLKLAQRLLEEILVYQPPWLGTELVRILRSNAQMDQNVLLLAFNYCRRGEDLQFILNLREQQISKKNGQGRLSVQSIKKLGGELVERSRYVCLDNQVVVHQQEYANLVAQMTFGKQQLKEHGVFFRLLTVQPLRAFNYAINFNIPPPFIVSFLSQGLKRGVLHLHHLLPYLIRFLQFKLIRQQRDYQYIRYREFKSVGMSELMKVSQWEKIPSVNGYVFTYLKKSIQNLEIGKLITPEFLQLYVPRQNLYRFLFEEAERRQMVLQLRGQSMTKPNARILRQLSWRMGVDIVELSLYELSGKLNSQEEMEDAQWDTVLKLIFWVEDRADAEKIVTKLSQKVQSLKKLIGVYDYMRQSQTFFKQVITEEHLEIIKSLAEIEQENNFFGIIPEDYFKEKIGVKIKTNRGVLSTKHRQILEKQGNLWNIFLLSKSLYFMYGCDEEIQKVVLGEFSLRQLDSQEFQILRKKIKLNQIE